MEMEEVAKADAIRNKRVVRYGPVIVDDARKRAVADEYARFDGFKESQIRLYKKDFELERGCYRRWISWYKKEIEQAIKDKRSRLTLLGRTKRAEMVEAL